MNLIFDSNALIEHFRSSEGLTVLESTLPRAKLYLSSVVAMELLSGYRTRSEARALHQFFLPFEQAGRVVSPSHTICVRAGRVLAMLRRQSGLDAEARRRISNDVLIAVSAVSIGAAIVTENRSDFARIAECIPLRWFSSVAEFLRASPSTRNKRP